MSEPFTLDDEDPNAGNDFEDLPPGTYLTQIEECESGESSKGTPQLRVQFRVQSGEFKNRVVSDWMYFTQNTQSIVATKLKAAGVAIPKGIKTADQAPARISGLIYQKIVQIVVREDKYNGETRTKVHAWKAAPEALQHTPTATAVGVASGDDEDIPFMYRDTFDPFAL